MVAEASRLLRGAASGAVESRPELAAAAAAASVRSVSVIHTAVGTVGASAWASRLMGAGCWAKASSSRGEIFDGSSWAAVPPSCAIAANWNRNSSSVPMQIPFRRPFFQLVFHFMF